MNKAIIQLGGNRGDVIRNFETTIQRLEERVGRVTLKSAIYETEPWGYDDVRWFLNQVIEVETNLDPESLLSQTQQIEVELGREVKKDPDLFEGRPIDLDILFYNTEIIHSDDLVIPHPYIRFRRFVLQPLCDHWGDLVHPEFGAPLSHLLKHCDDIGVVKPYK